MNLPALSPVVLLYGYPMFCERNHSYFFLFPSSFVCVLVFFFLFFFFSLKWHYSIRKRVLWVNWVFPFFKFYLCMYLFFWGGGGFYIWIPDIFWQIERCKIDEMRIPEKVTFTLPSSDASVMRLSTILMQKQSDDVEVLLETEQLNANLPPVS